MASNCAGNHCGAGSPELIGILTRAYAGPGDEVLHSRYGFLMCPIIATANGATPVPAAERDVSFQRGRPAGEGDTQDPHCLSR